MTMLGWIAAAAAEPLHLDEALEEALAANLELRQQALALDISERSLVKARGAFDPTLNLSASTAANNSPNNDQFVGQEVLRTSSAAWSAGVSQLLPTGATASLTWWETSFSSNAQDVITGDTVSERLSFTVSQPLLRGVGGMWNLNGARITYDDAEFRYRQAVEQTMIDVSDRYWRLVSASMSLDLAIRSREIAEQSVLETQERYREGFAGIGDVHQVERALGTAQQAEVFAQAEAEAAELTLRRLLGRDVLAAEPLDAVDRPLVPTDLPGFEEVLSLAREANAQWLRDRLAYDQQSLGARRTRNLALPDLRVNGGVGLSGLAGTAPESRDLLASGDFNDWNVSATMSMPLPGRALRADLETARMQQVNADLDLEAAEQDLVLRVRAAIRQVDRDRARASLATATVRFARLALDSDQELLREGKGATRNVVMSLDSLNQATAAELVAQIDLQRSLLELKRVAGTLVGGTE
jgi:outer membrane protein